MTDSVTDGLIGAREAPRNAPPPSWPIGPPEVPSEYFTRRGIPEDWIESCQVIHWRSDPPPPLPKDPDSGRLIGSPEDWLASTVAPPPTPEADSPIEFRVGWPDPPRTVEDLLRAARLGMHLTIRLEDDFDLARIAQPAAEAEALALGNSSAARNWGAFAAAGPRALVIGSAREPLPPMPRLEHLVAMGRNAVYALAGPRIAHAHLDLEREAWPGDIGPLGPLVTLEVNAPEGLTEVPPLGSPEALEVFRLAYLPDFDLSRLAAAARLRWLDLVRVRVVRGFAALAGLRELDEVNLAGISEAPDGEAIGRLRARRLTLEDNRIVPRETAIRWMAEHPGWSLALGRGPITV